MQWPTTPVEHLGDFQPKFCPRSACPEHLRRRPGYRFWRHGFYSTRRRRRIPRFRCRCCKQTFSRQTFSVSYYLKRPELLRPVAAGLVAGSALRQIARSVDAAPNTVAGVSARLGRHALLLHARCLEQLRGKVEEPVVLDHFETFEFTQDFPFGVATAVGARSWFLYGLDPAPHGRGGRRSTAQRRRLRSRPRRKSYGCYTGSTRRSLDLLLQLPARDSTLEIVADDHMDYRRVIGHHPERHRIRARHYPNPPRGAKGAKRSARAVARDWAMFPVDLLHKILRHTLAHHRRETIAFARRLNAAMERLFLTAVWRNLVKKRSERRPDPTTPAMRVGLTDERWNWKRLLSRRLFFDRIELPEPWPLLYRRGWTTPLLASNARHNLRRAF